MPDSIQESFFRHNLRIFKSLLLNNQWPDLNKPEYIERVDEMIEKCTERGQRVFTAAPPGGYNVLNHGDFFMRNMLFREMDGKVSDVRFVSKKILHSNKSSNLICHINQPSSMTVLMTKKIYN
jgi:Ecdysteroid kinase-like family